MSCPSLYVSILVHTVLVMFHLLQRLEVLELLGPLPVRLTMIGYPTYCTKKLFQTAKIFVPAVIPRLCEEPHKLATTLPISRRCGE